jgi:multiple sugar transport system permease protein
MTALKTAADSAAPATHSLANGKRSVNACARSKISRKFVSYLIARGCVHLMLLCIAGVFIFPFLWMLGMSLKTDDEAASGNLFPSFPTFRADSPFVRNSQEPERPAELSGERWSLLLPQFVAWAREQVAKGMLPAGMRPVDADSLRDAAAAELAGRIISRIGKQTWALPDDKIFSACASVVDAADVTTALNDRLARLEFRGLQIRSLDDRVFRIPTSGDPRPWVVESGPAELLPVTPGVYCLRYHFASPNNAPVVLRCDFNSPISPEQLERIIISIKGDDSWHRIDATLELGGKRWVSTRSYYIAQFRVAAILLQPPTFQDTIGQPKTWLPIAEEGSNQSSSYGSSRATLRLFLRPSSTWQAVLGKIERNYVRAFRAVPFFTYLTNSVLLVILTTSGSLFSASFVGYAFSRLNWPGRSLALSLLLSTMMLPPQVTMIPSFLIWRWLGWYNTLNPLWVGAWFGNAFFIFLMIQNMKTIPRELDEAARIDGLNAIQTWWYVIMPQVKPTLAAIAILSFMGAWNEFMGPLIMLRDQDKFPLSLGLFGMHVDQSGDWNMIMAANMLMVLPVVIIFFLFQRYFVEGMTVSGMKG